MTQLAFHLPGRAAYARNDFFVSPTNAQALAAVDGWAAWPSGKMLIVGPSGAGKTHLAHLWASAAGGIVVSGADLAATDMSSLPHAVAVDDANGVLAEDAFFHLHNLVTQSGALLMTATTPPRDWGLKLPDLFSRMQATAITRLDAPDDALLAAVLVKLFADRQIAVQPTLIPYLVQRMVRSLDAAQTLVARLDARALADGRPITRALAADLLDAAHDR
jgi:chromosomal replication initiation ATPase DnaA